MKKRIQSIKKKNTFLQPSGKEYNVYLRIDQQSFCITPYPVESKFEANWYRNQLSMALDRLIETHKK